MPILATVILDSGCFLPVPESNSTYTEIGYFGSIKSISDIAVKADGRNINSKSINLGKQCEIEVRHVKADGMIKKDGVYGVPGFQDNLLHLEDLYDEKDIPAVYPEKFDCILHFDSGLFAPALVKPHKFKKHIKQAPGIYIVSPDEDTKTIKKGIAHNIYVYFKLEDGDSLQLAIGGKVFWSSEQSGAKERLDIEILADNTTVEKFYRFALDEDRDSYWLPNQGDPPPICPLTTSAPHTSNDKVKISPLEKELMEILLLPHIDIAEIEEIASLSIEQVDARLQEMGLDPNETLPERLLRFTVPQKEFDNIESDEKAPLWEITSKKVSILLQKDLSGIGVVPQMIIEEHGIWSEGYILER
jgi:hypothetical protein